jgi:hypothetical protein
VCVCVYVSISGSGSVYLCVYVCRSVVCLCDVVSAHRALIHHHLSLSLYVSLSLRFSTVMEMMPGMQHLSKQAQDSGVDSTQKVRNYMVIMDSMTDQGVYE